MTVAGTTGLPWLQSAGGGLPSIPGTPPTSGSPAAQAQSGLLGGSTTPAGALSPEAKAYFDAHPEVLKKWDSLGDKWKADRGVKTLDDYALQHYNKWGKGAGWEWGAAGTEPPEDIHTKQRHDANITRGLESIGDGRGMRWQKDSYEGGIEDHRGIKYRNQREDDGLNLYRKGIDYIRPESTVHGQLQGLLSDSDPLMQRAKTKAMQHAQSRGLQNSSMAATAGQAAMIDAAMPIAQADAAMYGKFDEMDAQYDMGKDMQLFTTKMQERLNEANFAQETQGWLMNSFTDLTGGWSNNFAAIMSNPKLTPGDRATMIQQGTDWINSSISTLAELGGFSYEL